MFESNCKLYLTLILIPLKRCVTQSVDTAVGSDAENEWFNRLAINLLSYALVLIPSAVIVFTVKNNLCLKSVSENYYIKCFVFGKNESNVDYINSTESDLNEKLLPLSINDSKPPSHSSLTSWMRSRRITLILYCFLGLQISYLSWGLLQEKIMTTEYVIQSQFFTTRHKHLAIANNFVSISSNSMKDGNGIEVKPNEELETSETYHLKFRNSQFLVLINRILAFIIAFIALKVKNLNNSKTSSGREPPLFQYIYCSLSNILSSWCQYEALKFVSFPTQVLSKACKIMPVMLMSQLVGGKKYRTVEYLFAVSISIGMTIFLFSDHSVKAVSHKTTTDSDSGHYYGGLVILILYLTFDSFTSNWQTVLFDRYKMSTLHMMASVNFFSILLTSTSLIEQGDLVPAFELVVHNSQLLSDCVLLSIFSAVGQLFVFYTISTFGALVFVTIMTLRQAMAILLSCVVFSHPLAPLGFFGVLIVFTTLFTQIYWKFKSKSKR